MDTDIFPADVASEIELLSPPKKNGMKNSIIYGFIPYLDSTFNKIYYRKLTMDHRLKAHFELVLSQSKKVVPIKHRDFIDMHKILCNSPKLDGNVDQRAGFKFKNIFLVKKCFTFGERRVEEGTCHLLQLSTNCLHLYYFRGTKYQPRSFNTERTKFYKFKKLQGEKKYFIPEGIIYVLISPGKALFSLTIWNKDIPSSFQNIIHPVAPATCLQETSTSHDKTALVRSPKKRSKENLNVPPATPQIEEQTFSPLPVRKRFRESIPATPRIEEMSQPPASVPSSPSPEPNEEMPAPSPLFETPCQKKSHDTLNDALILSNLSLPIPSPAHAPAPTPVPTPKSVADKSTSTPALMLPIVKVPSTFVALYQSMKWKVYDDPQKEKIAQTLDDTVPLNLKWQSTTFEENYFPANECFTPQPQVYSPSGFLAQPQVYSPSGFLDLCARAGIGAYEQECGPLSPFDAPFNAPCNAPCNADDNLKLLGIFSPAGSIRSPSVRQTMDPNI